jgi:hypothetical protein
MKLMGILIHYLGIRYEINLVLYAIQNMNSKML